MNPTSTWIPNPGDEVRTTDGGVHRLGTALGMGGQGAVFSLAGTTPPLCVKIYLGLDEARAAAIRERLERLRQLGATEALVLPRRVLQAPLTGYVMDQVVDARSLTHWAVGRPPAGQNYADTGGLRRRLLFGVRIAWAFQELHARGLAYCDISFENVFAFERGAPEIRLIDCDNLTLPGVPAAGVEGTQWFIAPEILDGRSRPDAQTDAHSLAVLLYHLLVQTHPLLGDMVRESPPELEERALLGSLPWIDHPDEIRNRSSAGIPRHRVLSPSLQEAFHRAFSSGLTDRSRRPAEGWWAEALARAADATRTCQKCRHTMYYPPRIPCEKCGSIQPWSPGVERPCSACGRKSHHAAHAICDWCGGALDGLRLLLIQHAEGPRPVVVEQGRYLFPRHLRFRQGTPREKQVARVDPSPGGFRLQNDSPETFHVTRRGQTESLPPGGAIELAPGDRFQMGDESPIATLRLGQ